MCNFCTVSHELSDFYLCSWNQVLLSRAGQERVVHSSSWLVVSTAAVCYWACCIVGGSGQWFLAQIHIVDRCHSIFSQPSSMLREDTFLLGAGFSQLPLGCRAGIPCFSRLGVAFQLGMHQHQVGKLHSVWKNTVSQLDILKETVKAQLLIKRYPLSTSRTAGKKWSDTCPLCGSEPETTAHFLLRCSKLSTTAYGSNTYQKRTHEYTKTYT